MGNGLSCMIGSMALSVSYTFMERLPLVVGMWILLAPVAISWWRLRQRPPPKKISRSRIRKLSLYSGLIGHYWAACMLWYIPNTPLDVFAFLVTGSGFIAAGSAAILYVVPRACILYAAPMMGASLYLTATSGSASAVPLTLAVVLMTFGIGWMLRANWLNFQAVFTLTEEKAVLLEKAARATEETSAFLENITHEIRNPLTSVIGFANLLQDADTKLSPDLRHYVKNILNAGEALKMLSNDLLDLAKIDQNHLKIQPTPFQLRVLLEDSASLVSLGLQAKNLGIELVVDREVPEWLYADSFRLRQVILNLLGNAIKFTEKGHVYVHASWASTVGDEGMLAIKLADTGPGIPKHARDLIFKRFFKLPNVTPGASEGTGLGLAISQELISRMGGTMELRPAEPAYKTVFGISLPTRRLEPQKSNPVAAASLATPVEQRNILVADDMPANRELMRTILESAGHAVTEVANGTQAITQCTVQKFDLIFMDIDMPGIDGVMATHLLRSQSPENRHTPVVAVTGHIGKSQHAEFLEAGMNDYLSKPLTRLAILGKVDIWAAHSNDPTQANS